MENRTGLGLYSKEAYQVIKFHCLKFTQMPGVEPISVTPSWIKATEEDPIQVFQCHFITDAMRSCIRLDRDFDNELYVADLDNHPNGFINDLKNTVNIMQKSLASYICDKDKPFYITTVLETNDFQKAAFHLDEYIDTYKNIVTNSMYIFFAKNITDGSNFIYEDCALNKIAPFTLDMFDSVIADIESGSKRGQCVDPFLIESRRLMMEKAKSFLSKLSFIAVLYIRYLQFTNNTNNFTANRSTASGPPSKRLLDYVLFNTEMSDGDANALYDTVIKPSLELSELMRQNLQDSDIKTLNELKDKNGTIECIKALNEMKRWSHIPTIQNFYL